MRRSLLFLTLTACTASTTPEPATVRARINDDLGHVLRETVAANDGSTKDLPGAGLVKFATGIAMPEVSTDIDVDATITWLTGTLFTDSNYIGDGVYRFPAESLCKTDAGVDADCVKHVDLAHARIRVEDSDGLRFAIQLGSAHDEPIAVTLRHDEVAVTIDLDDASDAMIALAEAFGDEAPNAELSGQVTADLKILGTAHARGSISIERALAVKIADQGAPLDGDTATRFTSAAGASASIELAAAALHAQVALGQTTAHAAGKDIALAGVTGEVTASPSGIQLDHISLGGKPMTISVGGQLGESVDLNPADGRSVDLAVAADGTLSATPRFDLARMIDHAILGDDPPLYDVTRVLLAGTLRGTADQIEVASGTFSIETNPAMFGVSAATGQCVTTDQTEYSLAPCL